MLSSYYPLKNCSLNVPVGYLILKRSTCKNIGNIKFHNFICVFLVSSDGFYTSNAPDRTGVLSDAHSSSLTQIFFFIISIFIMLMFYARKCELVLVFFLPYDGGPSGGALQSLNHKGAFNLGNCSSHAREHITRTEYRGIYGQHALNEFQEVKKS